MILIRPLTINDIDRLPALQPAGWVPIEPSFQFFLSQPFCFPFVAEQDGRLVGSANGIQNKTSAWISHIIVAEKFRQQGIGRQLTEFIVREMQQRGLATMLLVASELGEKLYPRFGFQPVGTYHFYSGDSPGKTAASSLIRGAMPADSKAVFALDKKMSGEDRSNMLRLFIPSGYVYECRFPRRICGFYLPTLGEGLIVASDNDAGMALFKKRLATYPDRIVVPADNIVVNDYLAALGFERTATAPRMVLGKNVKWRPRLMFSRVGGWYG